MKKKLLLIIGMFLFVTNAHALSFNVNVTNIEDKGSGSLGTIKKIDLENREVDAFFDEIGAEINFDVTVTNLGDRAGTLREITVTGTSENFEYTTNLPEGGLAIDGNGANTITITGRVKDGATNGKTSSEIKIKYNYDEGSCPEGEILSDDESMCLCPTGKVRTDSGTCEEPSKPIECEKDEVYNTEKKICEKKVVPAVPNNPKTLDNIILITLLFFVSGLGIYAVMFKRFKTNKKRVAAGVITGVATLGLSFTVLASVFGLDNLLSAIINPITKSKEITIKVNEEIDLIETWDGECSLDVSELTPDNIFQGGTGTESDPYQVKTAEQLSCFAKSVNNGTTYEGQYIKQTKNIKLNDNLNNQATNGDLSNAHVWISAGHRYYDDNLGQNVIKTFKGQYDGDNKIISGLYLTDASIPATYGFKGLFGHATNATFKNIELSDVYVNTTFSVGALLGFGYKTIVLDNITTYGTMLATGRDGAGLVSNFDGANTGSLRIENSTNNINLTCGASCSGVIHRVEGIPESAEPNVILRNVINNGNIVYNSSSSGEAGIFGYMCSSAYGNILIENCGNNGTMTAINGADDDGGILGWITGTKIVVKNSYNTGDFVGFDTSGHSGGLIGRADATTVLIDNSYNSGDFLSDIYPDGYTSGSGRDYLGGIIGYTYGALTITNSYNTGDITVDAAYTAGLVGNASTGSSMENCYNTGKITGYGYVGGLVSNFIGTINKSYNKGNLHIMGGPRSGGIVGWGGASVYNSYNEGNILVTSEGGQHGGICANECPEIKNCYNKGDILAKNYGTNIAGIAGQGNNITNVYNSGTVTYEAPSDASNADVSGIASSGVISHAYNLGSVMIYQNGNREVLYMAPAVYGSGIAYNATVSDSVNKGSVIIIVNEPYTYEHEFSLSGITTGLTTNSFNAGELKIDDSALTTKLSEDGLPHVYFIGQINRNNLESTGNKFNTTSEGKALGCVGVWPGCTEAVSNNIGIYTDEEAPDILSIINGDNAFNDELDEDGLPTLKVFNQ